MAKTVIKESEIKNYIHSLLNEAINNEVRVSDPRDVEEREKMLAGQPYDRSYFQKNGKSWNLEREYRKQHRYPELRKPKGGVIPRLIGANGEDLTPENKPEAIEASMEAAKERNRENTGNKYIKKQDREEFAQRNDINPEDAMNTAKDAFANNPEKSPEAQRWMNMSDEEKAAERERLRKERIQASIDSLSKTQAQMKDLQSRPGTKFPTRRELEQKIEKLKAERDSLEDNQLNQDAIRELDKFIKDKQTILNKYYGDKYYDDEDPEIDRMRDDADNIAKMNAQDGINPYEYETPDGENDSEDDEENTIDGGDDSEEEDEYDNTLDDIIGGGRGKRKRSNFDNAREMGFYDNDDDYMFEAKSKRKHNNKVTLKESQLRKIIKESVIKILNSLY